MMAGGCPSRTVHHATHAADMALAMIAAMPQIRVMLKQVLQNQTERAEREDDKLRILKNFNIKVGLNTGQVTAGVIGATCRRFKLFGDTVNTASRMESNSLPNFIQVSETTFKHLIKTRAFLFKKREPMKIKGKGIMQTYFLMGKTKDKDAVEHDVLENLMTQEDFVRFNFVDVCERVVEESKDQDESGDMIGSVVEMAESLKQPDASLRENGAHANTASNEGGARGVVQYDELNKSEAFMSTYTKLETREKPQLHVNQTLLFLFGYDFSVIKPGADEAMLETHYHLHVFVKHRVTVRFVFSAIFTMMVFLCGYDAWSLKHNMLILILRYSICLPFLAIFIIFSYHRRFFHFQQLSLFITWLVLGTSVVMIGTYEAPQPGYGILLIVLSVIFFLDSLYFINRLIIVFLLAILHCAMLYNSCVKYNTLERDREDDRLHHSDPLVHALKVDLSEIGKTFCVLMGDQICLNGHSNSREKTSCYVETFGENKTFYDQFVDDDDEADELENAVRTVLWRGLMKLQSVAPFPALRQVLIIFFFCCLLTYPNWLSDYFNRVCFNRVQKEYEMEKEGKQAQARTTKFLNQLVPPSIVPLLSQGKFIADKLDDATIIFVDMVGFTKFSSELDPDELVMFLNELYSRFDTVLDQFGLYKVEIIGDALFAVAGAPEERYDKYHAARAVCAANGLLQEVVKLRDFLEISIKIRIGIHTGSCVAGVVGIKDPRYHLFGVTCANAEMIESTGSAGRIHISQATADSIKESGASTGITFTKRDENDLPPLKADASDKERAERQQTVDNIDDARKRVGSSYFADVDVEMIMNFPDLQAVSDEGQHHPRMRRDTEDINFINRSSH